MQDLDDLALLREYAANHSETAFEELVSRRVGFVYSSALRQARDPHLAGEITQAVFIILAQKAGRISDKTILTGWLFKTTRFAALAQMRAEMKRSLRTATIEKEFQMQNEFQSAATDEIWNQMSPLLDEALASLGETDRQAVLLRFFENKSLVEVGNYLGAGEDTARKRVSRALEKLRKFFTKRGVSSTTAIIAGVISTNSVQAAPVALAKSVTAVAIAKGAVASTSTLTLIKGALKIMAWTKAKTAIAVGLGVLLAAGTTTVVIEKSQASSLDIFFVGNLSDNLEKAPPVLLVRLTHFSDSHMAFDSTRSAVKIKAIGRNVPLESLMATAYGFPVTRMFFPMGTTSDRFDYLAARPNCPPVDLQAEIRKQTGWTAKTEKRRADVLLLKMKSTGLTGLKPSTASSIDSSSTYGNAIYHAVKQPFGDLLWRMEAALQKPVVDETELTGEFDFILDFSGRPGEKEATAWMRVLPDQLGLELVPTNMPIEMLVVEKVK